jgi:ribonuclease Z
VRLTFLGTSAGKPTRERNVSAVALECAQERFWYLFDCGEGTQHQILRSHLNAGKLGTIFISHLHGDHYYGLPGLLSTKKLDQSTSPITLYGPKGIRRFVEAALNISEAHLGYRLTITEYEPYQQFKFGRFSVTILPLVHSKESVAFYIREYDTANRLDEGKLRAMGLEPSPLYGELKQGRSILHEGRKIAPASVMRDPVRGRRLIIAGDNREPEVMGNALEGIDLLVHECTYTQSIYDNLLEKTLHTTARDLGMAAQQYGVKHLIATHINPRYNARGRHPLSEVSEEIAAHYKGRLFIAEDFASYRLGRDYTLKPC